MLLFDVTKFGDIYYATVDNWENLKWEHYYCLVYTTPPFLDGKSQQFLPAAMFANSF